MQDFALSPEEVLGLPLDQLGLAILKDLLVNNETNEVNWIQAAARSYGPDAVQALAEGWAWLHQNGLVARGQQTMYAPGLIFVTRLGRQVAVDGLPMVRAIQRLGLDLALEGRQILWLHRDKESNSSSAVMMPLVHCVRRCPVL
jgi:hypothetical protein